MTPQCNGNKKIHIAHVISCLCMAGMELGVIRQSNALSSRQFKISIIHFRLMEEKALSLISPEIQVFCLTRKEGLDLRLTMKLAKLLKQQRIDVVHSHNWTTFLYTVAAAHLAKVPVIIHGEHGRDTQQYNKDWKRLWARRLLASRCDYFTTVSSNIAQELQTIWKLSSWKVSWLPNGVDLDVFHEKHNQGEAKDSLGLDRKSLVIGTVIGTIRPVKDLPNLMTAFSLVREMVQTVQLIVVGSSPNMNEFKKLADKLGIADSIHFLDKHTNVAPIIAAMDVYVNSSLYEGMSNTILEAMASGVPVVATAVGGTPDILSHQKTGLLVPPKDSRALSQSILRILSEPEKSVLLTRNARTYVERNHDFSETIRKYNKLYQHWYLEKHSKPKISSKHKSAKKLVGNINKFCVLLKSQNKVHRKPIHIINYHRILYAQEAEHYLFQSMVQSPTVFERQLDFFRRYCNVISLDECVAILSNGSVIPERALVLTFDDAYQDIYHVAKPMLEKYQLPATIFVPVGLIDQIGYIWFDEIGDRLRHIDLDILLDSNDLCNDFILKLKRIIANNPNNQNLLRTKVVKTIINYPPSVRDDIVETLLQFESPDNGFPDNSLLEWQQIREMNASELFNFGSHSMNHQPLDLLSEDDLRIEIGCSKQLMEEKINSPVYHFSFPWGRYNEKAREMVKQFDYKSATILTNSPNYAGEDLYALKRTDAAYLTIDRGYHEGFMTAELSGINYFIRSRRKAFAN